MADKKISALTSLAQGDVAVSTDVLPIVDTSATETKKVTAAALVGAGLTAGVTNVDINSGSIDGTTIGANSAAAGTFTNLTASGTVSFSGATVSNGGSVTTVDINGGTIDGASIGASSASTGSFTTLTTSSTVTLNGGTANGVLYLNGSKVATSGSALVFDGTNLGLGATPATWIANFKAIEGTYLTIADRSDANNAYFGSNFKRVSGTDWTYKNTAAATMYQTGGQHIWYYAGSGTANTAITWSEGMRLDTAGNLGIGTSSPSEKLQISNGRMRFLESGQRQYNIGIASGTSNFVISDATFSVDRLLIEGSGNVGIGTSSPATRVDVQKSDGSGRQDLMRLLAGGNSNGNGATLALGSTQTQAGYISGLQTASNEGTLVFGTQSGGAYAERARIDSSGNLGLGVTPSAWSAGYKAIQIAQQGGAVFANTSFSQAGITSNGYYDGSNWIYNNGDSAGQYRITQNSHAWFTAPSGTAGNTISFTQAMTLDASGNLGVGTTSPGSFDASADNLVVGTTSGNNGITIAAGTTGASTINFADATSGGGQYAGYIDYTHNGDYMRFGTNGGNERARITSSGTLCVNATTGTGTSKLTVQQTAGSTSAYFGTSDQGIYFSNDSTTPRLVRLSASGSFGGGFIFTNGNTDVGTFTLNNEFIVGGTTDQGAYNLQCNGTGVWGAGAYVNGSDARLKDNIQSLDSGLDVVKAMRPVTFQYKPEYSKDQSVQPGFIAQELQEAMAGKAYLEGVVQEGTNHLNVAYQNIIPILVKAIQELEAKVAALESK